MSTIKKQPMIEKIINKLTDEQVTSLITTIDSTVPETFTSWLHPIEAPYVGAVRFRLESTKERNGILIRIENDSDWLLVYGESQKITIYQLNYETNSYLLVEEYCDINELRRVASKNFITTENIEANTIVALDELEVGENATLGENLQALIGGGGGGTKLYKHIISGDAGDVGGGSFTISGSIINTSSEAITTGLLNNLYKNVNNSELLLDETHRYFYSSASNYYGITFAAGTATVAKIGTGAPIFTEQYTDTVMEL